MSGAFTVVDLSRLPAPDVVEQIDYDAILAEMLADLVARDPAFSALVESDPAMKVLQVAAYRETLLRQRVNDAARAVMLAFAQGSDLDHIAANYNVGRLTITPANPQAVPPEPAVMESDQAFRARIPLSLEGYTTAGSEGSYVYHALSASGSIKDVAAESPEPGYVTVYVLSRDGDGTADQPLLDRVAETLNGEQVRPLTDNVTVLSAGIIEYEISAELVLYPGPDPTVVEQAAAEALAAYISDMHRIGYDVNISGIMQALHRPGVQRVNLAAPMANVVVSTGQAAYCTSVTLTVDEDTDV